MAAEETTTAAPAAAPAEVTEKKPEETTTTTTAAAPETAAAPALAEPAAENKDGVEKKNEEAPAPAAATAAPESEEKKDETTPPAAAPAPETPFTKLAARLPEITKSTGHTEMWGVELSTATPDEHVPTKVVLQKFLRANSGDASAAEKQLTSALEWRKKIQPTALVDRAFDDKKFGGLGYVTVHKDEAKDKETVITWNVYGAVKDNKKTFGDVEEFIKWRAALMELGVQKLNLSAVTAPIPEGGEDPYQMIQVHDYMSVSFFKMDPHVKAASKETIQTFGMAYPELLAHKYFVNVPTIMGWMYAAMKLFLAPATLRKFHPMSSGTSLAAELPGIAGSLPKEYGGKAGSVEEVGLGVKLAEVNEEVRKEEVAPGASEAPVAAVKEETPAETKTEDAKPAEEAKPEEPKVEVSKPAEETKAAAEPEKKDAA